MKGLVSPEGGGSPEGGPDALSGHHDGEDGG